MQWVDIFRIFSYAFSSDPLSRKSQRDLTGAGISQVDAIPDIRGGADGTWGGGGGSIRLRDTNDFVDLSTVTNRIHRYKEYERLRNMAEIEMAMTVFADEACLAGDTKVATPHGFKTLKDLAERQTERFLVYCYDFAERDYTLGWAHSPRKTKTAKTIEVILDDGNRFVCTPDHRILTRDANWCEAGMLNPGDFLMPFYRINAKQELTKLKHNQFPRIFTHTRGWIHERQFVDDFSYGRTNDAMALVNKYCRMIAAGLGVRDIRKLTGNDFNTIQSRVEKAGFSNREIKWLSKKKDCRRIVHVSEHEEIDVYDLTVEKHENFATNWGIVHNCQKNDDGRVMTINTKNVAVKEELEFLLFHRKMLNFDQKKLWNVAKNLFIMGDFFYEVVINIENPKEGILNLMPLPADSIYRIETTKGRLIEFQQSKEGPDFQSLARVDITQATDADIQQATAIRFAPEQVVHMKIGDDRKTFYPYGVSLIEAARAPAQQLRLMEDAMVVYRLTRAPERRVFYIDVQQLPPHKAEAFIKRMKDEFRKRKVPARGGNPGASSVDERWHVPAADEDFWIPIRANANTRIETLPGACLALDTKIPLLDGRTLELQEIIKEFNEGKQLWAYSCCPKTGKSAPGLISWAGVTRKNTEVVRVTLDNGESIVCTPDHKFPVQGIGKVQAKDLPIGCSLFPFKKRRHKLAKNWKSLYEQIYDSSSRDWVFSHRMVKKAVIGSRYDEEMVFNEKYRDEKKNVVHHKDFNRYNNSPNNLAWMNWYDHKEYHNHNRLIRNKNISESLKAYHQSLSPELIEIRDAKLAKRSKLGSQALTKKLKSDKSFNSEFRKKQSDGWNNAIQVRPELHQERGRKIAQRNRKYWSDPENKKKAFEKQTIVFSDYLWERFVVHLRNGGKVADFLNNVNSSPELLKSVADSNSHLKRADIDFSKGLNEEHIEKEVRRRGFVTVSQVRNNVVEVTEGDSCDKIVWPDSLWTKFSDLIKAGDSANEAIVKINTDAEIANEFARMNAHKFGKDFRFKGKFTAFYIKQMVRDKGYKDCRHLKKEINNYNHKVVSIEFLEERMDTGTLTIDGNHELHDYHTFAVSPCYVMNSNLGEIDDTVYFRNKLFTALNFPRNYFNNEDAQSSRISLSAQDIKFARMIERLQSHMEDAFWEICDRHLKLLGYPEESYEDLQIKMTPPSDWRELTRAEVVTNRINNAVSIKGAMFMSDYDLLTKFFKYNEDETKKMLARLKIQKLEELKLQIISQNPSLGFGLPGNSETETGTEPGGPNPMLGGPPPMPQPGGMPPGGMPPGPPAGAPPVQGMRKYMDDGNEDGPSISMAPPPGQGPQQGHAALPEPSEEDVKKYDLDIIDFEKEIDEEEYDRSEME